jgi:hypothetical protein
MSKLVQAGTSSCQKLPKLRDIRGIPEGYQRDTTRGMPYKYQKHTRGIPEGYQRDTTRGIPYKYQKHTRGIPERYQRDTRGIPQEC